METSERQEASSEDIFEIAAEHATSRVPITSAGVRAGELRESLYGNAYDCASVIVVCDAGAFLGILPIEALVAAAADCTVGELMDRNAPTVKPGTDQEAAAWQAVRSGESALSVVDATGGFVGVITADKLLAVLLQEHEEDMARIGGFLKNSTIAHLASEEPLHRRLWHRVPWLLLGLVGFFLAADVIGYFEAALQEHLLLAFFVPGIVYIAGAVGTQTVTVVVRGLSVGISISRILVLEAVTGLVIGLALALVVTPYISWRWGEFDVAMVVGLTVFITCAIATVLAMLIPWLFDRWHIDPAFGSGPIATIAEDLASLVIYFTIALILLG